MVAPEAQDWGDQLKFVMGMASVDVAVLWPKNYGQFDVCYKPTSRLSQFASLGIPVVSYPFASYIDLFVSRLALSQSRVQDSRAFAEDLYEDELLYRLRARPPACFVTPCVLFRCPMQLTALPRAFWFGTCNARQLLLPAYQTVW